MVMWHYALSHWNNVFKIQPFSTYMEGIIKEFLFWGVLWSFSGWLTENLMSSWVCNCGSFCSMSATADFINKILWRALCLLSGPWFESWSSMVGYGLLHSWTHWQHTEQRLQRYLENTWTFQKIYSLTWHACFHASPTQYKTTGNQADCLSAFQDCLRLAVTVFIICLHSKWDSKGHDI